MLLWIFVATALVQILVATLGTKRKGGKKGVVTGFYPVLDFCPVPFKIYSIDEIMSKPVLIVNSSITVTVIYL